MDKTSLLALFDLTGRTGIVTGGTRGIGLAIAEGLGAAGANVVVASRKSDACQEAAKGLHANSVESLGVSANLGDPDAIEALVAQTVERFGGVDIVVNNAANALAQPLGAITPEAWNKSFAVNLQGPVFLVQTALPYLRDSDHAAVLNVVSAGAFVFSPGVSMYAAAKAAMVSFTQRNGGTGTSSGVGGREFHYRPDVPGRRRDGGAIVTLPAQPELVRSAKRRSAQVRHHRPLRRIEARSGLRRGYSRR